MPGEDSQRPGEEEPSCEGKASGPSGGKSTDDILEPATEERYNFRFSAGKEFTGKFKRLAEVLSIQNAHSHLEEIFEQTLEIALEKKDPKRKLERRRKREEKKQSPRPGEGRSHTWCPRSGPVAGECALESTPAGASSA